MTSHFSLYNTVHRLVDASLAPSEICRSLGCSRPRVKRSSGSCRVQRIEFVVNIINFASFFCNFGQFTPKLSRLFFGTCLIQIWGSFYIFCLSILEVRMKVARLLSTLWDRHQLVIFLGAVKHVHARVVEVSSSVGSICIFSLIERSLFEQQSWWGWQSGVHGRWTMIIHRESTRLMINASFRSMNAKFTCKRVHRRSCAVCTVKVRDMAVNGGLRLLKLWSSAGARHIVVIYVSACCCVHTWRRID